jgi:hypothetical protein
MLQDLWAYSQYISIGGKCELAVVLVVIVVVAGGGSGSKVVMW